MKLHTRVFSLDKNLKFSVSNDDKITDLFCERNKPAREWTTLDSASAASKWTKLENRDAVAPKTVKPAGP